MADLDQAIDYQVQIVGSDSSVHADVVIDEDTENALKVKGNFNISGDTASPYKGKFFSLHLKLNGTGSNNMNVDGSTTPQHFYLTPPSGKKWFIHNLFIIIEDDDIHHGDFGGIIGGLTNGVLLKVKESGTERDLYEYAIKNNAVFYHTVFDVRVEEAVGDDILFARWKISDSGTVLELKNTNSDYVKCIVQDDLTALDEFEIQIQGYEVDE